jgi:hypothetical protein
MADSRGVPPRCYFDGIGAYGADRLVLRASAAGAADRTDQLAAVDQRNAASGSDDVVERQ